MRVLRLYIKDFMCYDTAYIDFTQFSSALVVGKMESDDEESNGVGKTTLFKSIEYVLFNQSDFNLERIVRDDATSCQVVFDFVIGDKEYRLSRKRTVKGSSDLSLYERTPEVGEISEVLHTDANSPLFSDKYWKDISGRRASDTEKDLAKLLKINLKSFRTFVHFMQLDFNSLATATASNRKAILKDALNLVVYAKLEKIAKEKSASLSRELDRCRLIVNSLGDPDSDLVKLIYQIEVTEKELAVRVDSLQGLQNNLVQCTDKISVLTNQYNGLETKFSSLIVKQKSLTISKSKLETSLKEYRTKKSNIMQEARNLVLEIKQLEENQIKLVGLDYSQIPILSEKIEEKKVLVTQHNVAIQNNISAYEELKIPMPTDSVCKHCRQPMTDQHRKDCLAKDLEKMAQLQVATKEAKANVQKLNVEIQSHQQAISSLISSKQHLETVITKIVNKKRENADKKITYDDYTALLTKFTNELKETEQDLFLVQEDLKNSSIDEAKVLQDLIQLEKENVNALTVKINTSNKEITHFSSNRAVIQHSIDQKNQDKQKKIDMSKVIKELENKLFMYPLVVQGFSSTGIPNLIIHNILDDLQIEVNTLLNQLRPGIQLSFSIEKTKGDGTEADTLDINYQVHGKDRYYEQLSGAMKLIVMISLKLGLSFYLQKMLNIEIKFLLLDELDPSLDKRRVDTFADIVKFLHKNFTVLVVTHNDRLKDKFSHAVLVEQDINMVSQARVVTSW